MAGENKNISIRLAVVDGEKVRKEFAQTGKVGEKALVKIREACKPATKSLLAINVVAEQAHYYMLNLAGSAGHLGLSLSRLGTAGSVAAAALGGVTLAISHSLHEFRECDKVLTQLSSALSATDFAAGVTAREIILLSEALAHTTLFKKEEFEKAASHLTSFANVQGKVFKRAIELSSDLAVRLGVDIPAASDMLGASLERPGRGLGRLSKKFTDLSASQKEAIENFVHQGEIMRAQEVILEHLESRIKGLAHSKGLAGNVKLLSDAWGNLLESLGSTISKTGIAEKGINSLTYALKNLKELIDPTLTKQKSQLEQEISMIEKSVWGSKLNKSSLGAKKKELAEINRQITLEQQKILEEEAQAHLKSKEAAVRSRNNRLLELEKQYLKEYENLTTSSQQKIFKEYEERHQQIKALNKDADSSSAKSAAKALDDLTKAKIEGSGTDLKSSDLKSQDYETAKAALDSWKESLVQNLDEASSNHQKYLRLVEDIYGNKLREIYERSTLDHNSWVEGAVSALNRYSLAAQDSASNAEKVFGSVANKIEDLLVDLVASGEFSFKKLGDTILSIEKDFLRSFMRQNVTGPLFSGLSGMMQNAGSNIFAKLFHSGGRVDDTHPLERLVPANMFISAPRLHSGLRADEFPAILERGETVLPKNAKVAGGTNITFNIQTPNAQSFIASQGQIMSTLAAQMQKHHLRNS